MKAFGVAVVTLATETTSTTIQIVAMRDYVSFNIYMHSIKEYLFPCLVMAFGIIIIRFNFSVNAISLLLSILVGVAIYVGYLLWEKDDFICSLLSSIFHH